MQVVQSGQTTRHTQDSDDTASSRQHQPGWSSSSITVAQTWSPGHLRTLAADAASSKLADPALARLDFEEGGLSPWKGAKGPTELDLEARLQSGNAVVHRAQCTASKPGQTLNCSCKLWRIVHNVSLAVYLLCSRLSRLPFQPPDAPPSPHSVLKVVTGLLAVCA